MTFAMINPWKKTKNEQKNANKIIVFPMECKCLSMNFIFFFSIFVDKKKGVAYSASQIRTSFVKTNSSGYNMTHFFYSWLFLCSSLTASFGSRFAFVCSFLPAQIQAYDLCNRNRIWEVPHNLTDRHAGLCSVWISIVCAFNALRVPSLNTWIAFHIVHFLSLRLSFHTHTHTQTEEWKIMFFFSLIFSDSKNAFPATPEEKEKTRCQI